MSAIRIFENAPIGSIVAWSDGTPRPPERYTKKLSAWRINNSQGRLVRKQGGGDSGAVGAGASFTLHEADFGAEQWLSEHRHPNAVLEEVTADETAADAIEGRAE